MNSTLDPKKTPTFEVPKDEPAPWEPEHPLQRNRSNTNATWRYVVYGGLFELGAVREVLEKHLHAQSEENSPDGRRDGTTATFAFALDADGYLIEDTGALSSCAWAVSRTVVDPGPEAADWLEGFGEDQRSFAEALNSLVPPEKRVRQGSGASSALKEELGQRVRGAGRDAWQTAAQNTGDAVGTAARTALDSVVGVPISGIAGAAAGSFVSSLLGPVATAEDGGGAGGAAPSCDAGDVGEGGRRSPRVRMTARALNDFVAELTTSMGLDAVGAAGVRVECRAVRPNQADGASDTGLLNSFVAPDLATVECAARNGDIGAALHEYLRDPRAEAERIDVRQHPEEALSRVVPTKTPRGKWPVRPDRPLVLSQQFAVNQMCAELRGAAGLFAVNGPPGTGKTTMLRDVLAANVVDRAERLAELDDPREAFVADLGQVEIGPRNKPKLHAVSTELTGFEMVVATANNAAAENITGELPTPDAVSGWEENAFAADYFADLAGKLRGEPSWGLITAVLGNASNTKLFADRLWKDQGDVPDWAESGRAEPSFDPVPGLGKYLKPGGDETAPPARSWTEAVRRFREALRTVDDLAEEREPYGHALVRDARSRRGIGECETELNRIDQELAECERAIDKAQQRCDDAAASVVEAETACAGHAALKPGFWRSLMRGNRPRRTWAARHRPFRERLDRAVADRAEAGHGLDRIREQRAELRRERAQQERSRDAALEAHAEAQRTLDEARRQWPGAVPQRGDAPGSEASERIAPWADAEFTAARNDLFLEALRLHKSFVLHERKRVRSNLNALVHSLKREVQLEPEQLRAAWQTLFLVVPAVSTTFASIPRLFTGLGREELGWLFIDEAGQVTPQAAVGALWRSKRALVLGDPQQLEPILTLPSGVQERLREYHDVRARWKPDGRSVQSLADDRARFGTELQPSEDEESSVWVGSPLRVHRRCERPMFDLSNRIGYGGTLMVYATAEKPNDRVWPSCWVDVRDEPGRDHWSEREGSALVELLTELHEQGVDAEHVRIISPFRAVVRQAADTVRQQFGRSLADRVGTIHTVQGRENDIIVLVLGAQGREGAQGWAARKPNLLNVAVSRAKRRFYVIGNHEQWGQQRYFTELAGTLPARPWPFHDR
ncbi:DEAD/DEAH box helicase [Bounagaea algeriensis]